MKYSKKYHIVYQITNKLNGKQYVGVHSTNVIDDGYMGSSETLTQDILEYGINNFEKVILAVCASRKLANMFEMTVIASNYVAKDDYNIKGNINLECYRKKAFSHKRWSLSASYVEKTYGVKDWAVRQWVKKHGDFDSASSLINSMLKGGRIEPDGHGKYNVTKKRNDMNPLTRQERNRCAHLINKAKQGKFDHDQWLKTKIFAFASIKTSHPGIIELDKEYYQKTGKKL